MGDPEIRDIPVEKQRDALDRVKAYAGSQGFEITGEKDYPRGEARSRP
jgi:hypothetical protein